MSLGKLNIKIPKILGEPAPPSKIGNILKKSIQKK
jgi:hypothetical protein